MRRGRELQADVEAKVLLVGAFEESAQSLVSVLRFLDLEPVCVDTVSELPTATLNDCLAILVTETGVAEQGEELVSFLRNLPRPAAIIYLSNGSLPQLADTSADLAWLPLDLPVKHRRLSYALDQAERLRSGHPVEPGRFRFRPSGHSRPMREIHLLTEQVAASESTVLVLGESGTGKEMVARHIHELSLRSKHPFVPVNCGAIPADLLESELFGHEKGAFTGALTARLGRFEFAEGGTLFLDEIGDMSLQMQVKLLRVLQERTFERVGSNRTIQCNVRIIAATHRDLEACIEAGRFREDLYYRLNVFPIQIPPLRDRLEDMPVLIEHLAERQQQDNGRRVRLSKEAINCLMRCRWPGNVRELSNLLERLAILYPNQLIAPKDLPERYRITDSSDWFGTGLQVQDEPEPEFRFGGAQATTEIDEEHEDEHEILPLGGLDLKDHLSAIEVGLIRKAMEEADGTVAEAARLLRMRRTTLVEKLRKYRLQA